MGRQTRKNLLTNNTAALWLNLPAHKKARQPGSIMPSCRCVSLPTPSRGRAIGAVFPLSLFSWLTQNYAFTTAYGSGGSDRANLDLVHAKPTHQLTLTPSRGSHFLQEDT